MNCKKCQGEMAPGVAIEQTWTGTPDLGEICTWSVGGPGRMIECSKCTACGWSVTVDKNPETQQQGEKNE